MVAATLAVAAFGAAGCDPAGAKPLPTAKPAPKATTAPPTPSSPGTDPSPGAPSSSATASPSRPASPSQPAPPSSRPAGALPPDTVPVAGQVGVRTPVADLRAINSQAGLPAGATWSGGQVIVRGANVTFERVYVKGSIEYLGTGTLTIRDSIIEGNANGWAVVLGRSGHLTIEDSTLRWVGPPRQTWGNGAVHGDSTMTLRRNDISGTPDGIQVGPGRSLIEQNYIHDLAMLGVYPNNTHNDGIQSYGGPDLFIRYNRIDISKDGKAYDGTHQNAAIFVQPGGTPCTNLQLIGNYLSGGGFILRLESPTRDATVVGNNFGPTTGGWGTHLVERGTTFTQWADNRDSAGRTIAQP
jgi:hypothetical protein